MKKILVILFIILCFNGCAYTSYFDDAFEDIPNFHEVNAKVFRGGRPSEDGLRQLKTMGIKTVISLRGDDTYTYMEEHLCRQYGLGFTSIPLSIYKQPNDSQVVKFLEIITDEKKQPVFVHCESGRDRTGAMIAVYRVIVEGWDIKEAYHESKKLGFWPYRGDAELKKFILQLNDKPQYFTAAEKNP